MVNLSSVKPPQIQCLLKTGMAGVPVIPPSAATSTLEMVMPDPIHPGACNLPKLAATPLLN